jgi:hypothetical protein
MLEYRASITTTEARETEVVTVSPFDRNPRSGVWVAVSTQAGDRTRTRTTIRIWEVAIPVALPNGTTITRTVYRWSAAPYETTVPWQAAAPSLEAAQEQAERFVQAEGLLASLSLSGYRAEYAKRKAA